MAAAPAGCSSSVERMRHSSDFGNAAMDLPDEQPDPTPVEQLTDLETSWTTIRNAHTPGPVGQAAMRDLIGRYHDAVERYLRVKLRDSHLADEVLQEFWTKLLTHKLAGADHTKGRFRDYLRTVLHRLIIDHFRTRKLQALPPGDLPDPTDPDQDYDRIWREVTINRVWSRLETYEASTPKNRYATVLHLRMDHPDAPIEEIAKNLGQQLGTPVTPEAFRKTLQRARSKFLELLIHELRETMDPASPEEIEAEIFDLGLGNVYRRYAGETMQ
jgi:RNA polymerase sigma factor (sigma-70 family)